MGIYQSKCKSVHTIVFSMTHSFRSQISFIACKSLLLRFVRIDDCEYIRAYWVCFTESIEMCTEKSARRDRYRHVVSASERVRHTHIHSIYHWAGDVPISWWQYLFHLDNLTHSTKYLSQQIVERKRFLGLVILLEQNSCCVLFYHEHHHHHHNHHHHRQHRLVVICLL